MRYPSLPVQPCAAAFLLMVACTGAGPEPVETAVRPESGPAATAELEALYRARLDSARQRYTDADVRFMTGMITHHAQALAMSALAPQNGASPAIRTLAARIINAQQDEIALMQQWLGERGLDVPRVHVSGTDVMVHGPGHGAHMPGMLTDDQMRDLAAARGAAFDRLFLTLMIQHHQGAVRMVEDLLREDGAAHDYTVFKLASDINVDQLTEIARMERMLQVLPADGRTP
jgi:uncharacterized protein (DUF305 family)